MDKEKKYPIDYSDSELFKKIAEYGDQKIGSTEKRDGIIMQEFAKASVGIAELQRRSANRALLVAIIALLISVVSLLYSLLGN